jgi:HAD superfamily hydrolase (TIGR01490 family)
MAISSNFIYNFNPDGNTILKSDNVTNYPVFVDLDDTLLTVSSGKVMGEEAFRQGLLKFNELFVSIWYSLLYKINLAHSTRIFHRMACWLKGMEEKTIKDLSENLVDQVLLRRLNAEVLSEIENHRNNNGIIVLLSSAISYICEPIVSELGIDDLICSRLEIVDGKFTGLPEGKLVFGPEKSVRLTEYCEINGFSIKDAYCYADSFSDLPALEICGHPVAVRPDRRLGSAARKRGWKIIK